MWHIVKEEMWERHIKRADKYWKGSVSKYVAVKSSNLSMPYCYTIGYTFLHYMIVLRADTHQTVKFKVSDNFHILKSEFGV